MYINVYSHLALSLHSLSWSNVSTFVVLKLGLGRYIHSDLHLRYTYTLCMGSQVLNIEH